MTAITAFFCCVANLGVKSEVIIVNLIKLKKKKHYRLFNSNDARTAKKMLRCNLLFKGSDRKCMVVELRI